MTYQDLLSHLMSLEPKYMQREIFVVDHEGRHWEIDEIEHYDPEDSPNLLPSECSVLIMGDCLNFPEEDEQQDDDIWIGSKED